MAQAMINFRMEAEEKNSFEDVCEQLGLTITTAFKMFAKKVVRERRIPFDVSLDPFYSESNIAHLRRGVKALNEGRGVEHELVEVD